MRKNKLIKYPQVYVEHLLKAFSKSCPVINIRSEIIKKSPKICLSVTAGLGN